MHLLQLFFKVNNIIDVPRKEIGQRTVDRQWVERDIITDRIVRRFKCESMNEMKHKQSLLQGHCKKSWKNINPTLSVVVKIIHWKCINIMHLASYEACMTDTMVMVEENGRKCNENESGVQQETGTVLCSSCWIGQLVTSDSEQRMLPNEQDLLATTTTFIQLNCTLISLIHVWLIPEYLILFAELYFK